MRCGAVKEKKGAKGFQSHCWSTFGFGVVIDFFQVTGHCDGTGSVTWSIC
jgi:hypothetical protein